MYCNNCGKQIDDNAVVCVHCGVPTQSGSAPIQSDEKLGCFMSGLCFLIPVVGLVLYLVWKDSAPVKAKEAGKWALIGFIVWFVFNLIYRFFIAGSIASHVYDYY
ncbi:MAG: zinc ribbon domain-containing protein [Candidatus Cloacimonadaceae bacterium]|jgi:uncharacterized membrane protein YvbJ|nr:zinc ribbon domain-containing protein [Candidatus Cloacimonadota bacterium]MDX9950260.1 zinc ribbon domain-containing protein [Candidatus Syntrophosphaera sp.]